MKEQLPTTQSTVALYRTKGNRALKHRCVLYLRHNKDWGARQLQRNGNQFPALAIAPMTTEAEAYCSERHRSASLQYDGKDTANLEGLAADLRTLGFDEPTITRFVEAAKPCFA